MEKLTHDLKQSELRRIDEARLGIRHALRHEGIRGLAADATFTQPCMGNCGSRSNPFSGNSLFDKSSPANSLVVCHQDTALPIQKRHDALGWRPWSVKDGVTDAHAPASALSQVSALRVHLDESNVDAGPEGLAGHTHERRFN